MPSCSWIFLLATLCLTTAAGRGGSLKCHVCNSVEDASCDDITDDTHLVACHTLDRDPLRNHTICRFEKFTATSAYFKMSTKRTVRTCAYTKHPKYECFFNSNKDLKETICECEEDGCNTGSNLQLACTSLALTFFTIVFVRSH